MYSRNPKSFFLPTDVKAALDQAHQRGWMLQKQEDARRKNQQHVTASNKHDDMEEVVVVDEAPSLLEESISVVKEASNTMDFDHMTFNYVSKSNTLSTSPNKVSIGVIMKNKLCTIVIIENANIVKINNDEPILALRDKPNINFMISYNSDISNLFSHMYVRVISAASTKNGKVIPIAEGCCNLVLNNNVLPEIIRHSIAFELQFFAVNVNTNEKMLLGSAQAIRCTENYFKYKLIPQKCVATNHAVQQQAYNSPIMNQSCAHMMK